MDISVIICTFNRADMLRETLDSFLGMEFPSNIAAELIVVDNNSSDSTRATTDRQQERHPELIRYLY